MNLEIHVDSLSNAAQGNRFRTMKNKSEAAKFARDSREFWARKREEKIVYFVREGREGGVGYYEALFWS